MPPGRDRGEKEKDHADIAGDERTVREEVGAESKQRQGNETAGVARTFLKANAHLGSDLGDTLGRLNETAEAVTRLADFLERNPNALLTGRRRPQ